MGLRDHYIAPKPTFRETTLTQVLREMNAKGSFAASVLATCGGLPVAVAPADFEAQTVAAMVALVKETVERAQVRIGMARVDEISALDGRGTRLVCRYFDVLGEPLILAVMVPVGREYRKFTDEAIRRLVDAWYVAPTALSPIEAWPLAAAF
jgi:predicted regulator of Ras-like GTPase activity (Roadblock/LC7/MglB family)